MPPLELMGMYLPELTDYLHALGAPAFRAKQVFSWLHKGAQFDEMTNLPISLRETLKAQAVAQPVKVLEHIKSKADDTVKFLFGFLDGQCVEGVLMRYHHGHTLCISTQVGCRMGCVFCASTLEGCVRNLTAAQMLGQIQCANRFLLGEAQINHVVLMGSGEPLDNYDEVIRFLRLCNDPQGLNISLRHISLSTCGLVEPMDDLAKEGLPVTLSVSLHAPNDQIRQKIMPVARRYPMAQVLAACRRYVAETGRRVIFEYALVEGLNSGPEHAAELAGKLRGMQCHVNLIPLNQVKEREFLGADEKTIKAFMAELEKRHISCTRRREMGDDIEGACGQLRRKTLMDKAGGVS